MFMLHGWVRLFTLARLGHCHDSATPTTTVSSAVTSQPSPTTTILVQSPNDFSLLYYYQSSPAPSHHCYHIALVTISKSFCCRTHGCRIWYIVSLCHLFSPLRPLRLIPALCTPLVKGRLPMWLSAISSRESPFDLSKVQVLPSPPLSSQAKHH